MTSKVKIPVNPNDGFHEIIAIAGRANSWGRGADAAAARKALRQHSSMPVTAYMVVPKGSWVNEYGNGIEWKLDVAGDIHKDGCCPLCQVK